MLRLQAIIGSLVQCFFAWRVKVLTNSMVAVILIGICALCQFCECMGKSRITLSLIPE